MTYVYIYIYKHRRRKLIPSKQNCITSCLDQFEKIERKYITTHSLRDCTLVYSQQRGRVEIFVKKIKVLRISHDDN